jgi:hypothetical protein
MLRISQSGSHEIETVESGQGIARGFNYMKNGGSDQAAPWADLVGRTGKQTM